uniref:Immunoglobulin V-set domain-containing protein n=1 Tax=Labrus bergylta TaxID=56723 RepID=A0A3Q3MFX3_9LABR
MGDFPKYLWKSYVGISENAPGISGERFKATTNGTSVPLKIQKLQLTDSAVYYCALRPTIGEGKTMKEFEERFSSTLDSTLRSVPLKIQKLQLTDSAVYYCALSNL